MADETTRINKILLDPYKWGWSAGGGVSDVVTPHDKARRTKACESFLRSRKRDRTEAFTGTIDESVKEPNGVAPMAVDEASETQPAAEEEKASASQQLRNGESTTKDTNDDDNRKPAAIPTDPERKAPEQPLHFTALTDGKLDIFTYHRGVEGSEYRSEESGGLLCDMGPTDTEFGMDAPETVVPITISFPIDQSVDSKGETPTFKETIMWDLAQLDRPTPAVLAAQIAKEYGLSRNELIDLTESIQEQIQTHVAEFCRFADPLSITPQLEERERAPEYYPDLYGQVTAFRTEGFRVPATQKTKTALRRPSMESTVSEPAQGKKPQKSAKGTTTLKKKATAQSSQVDKAYKKEVQKRLGEKVVHDAKEKSKPAPEQKDESPKPAESETEQDPRSSVISVVECSNIFCHACRKNREVGVKYQCSQADHCVCKAHWSKLYSAKHQGEQTCPFCVLSCSCQVCTRVLGNVAHLFKKKCEEVNGDVSTTEFDGLYSLAMSDLKFVMDETVATLKQPINLKRSETKVHKISPSDFPTELIDGVDQDPAKLSDFFRLYTRAGFVEVKYSIRYETPDEDTELEPAHVAPAPTEKGTIEDGSVDYCNVCKTAGDIICCDYCPRAFHQECIKPEDVDSESEDPWKCPCCIVEEKGENLKKIRGDASLPLIISAFEHCRQQFTSEDLKYLRVLSILHEIVLDLMEYDFGVIFSEPVDEKLVPGYSKIIKKPMDLGTIAKSLVNGSYIPSAALIMLEDIVVTVLKDIELVWHNCFTFNFEGSAVYLMAKVQQRRARALVHINLDTILSKQAKASIKSYVRACRASRALRGKGKMSKSIQAFESSKKGKARARPVAVIDPDYCQLVKIYKSAASAIQAVAILLENGHDCEWKDFDRIMDQKVRKIIQHSSYDPDVLVFGYRWVDLIDLRNGEVDFPEKPAKVLESPEFQTNENESNTADFAPKEESPTTWICRESKGRKVFYATIDEAVASNKDVDQSFLQSLNGNAGSGKSRSGYVWKIVPRLISDARLCLLKGGTLIGEDFSFYRADALRGLLVKGFTHEEDAFSDWQSVYGISNDKGQRAFFKESVLDSLRNYQGQFWRSNIPGPSNYEKINGAII